MHELQREFFREFSLEEMADSDELFYVASVVDFMMGIEKLYVRKLGTIESISLIICRIDI